MLELKNLNFLSILIPLLITLLFGFVILFSLNDKFYFHQRGDGFGPEMEVILYYIPFLDTIYYLGDTFIEVNLKKQKGYVFYRNGRIDSFPISSGNPNIHRAIATPTGLFAVQNKAPIQISLQFQNTEMINWIGFNGNIGFHGLKKRGYYLHLGKRPSSHGCIRISLEDGQWLYDFIKVGTPVLVYENKPFRIIRFSSMNDYDPSKDILFSKFDIQTSKLFLNRQQKLFEGKLYQFGKERFFLAPKIKSTFSKIQTEYLMEIPIQKQILFKNNWKKSPAISAFVAVSDVVDTCPNVLPK